MQAYFDTAARKVHTFSGALMAVASSPWSFASTISYVVL